LREQLAQHIRSS